MTTDNDGVTVLPPCTVTVSGTHVARAGCRCYSKPTANPACLECFCIKRGDDPRRGDVTCSTCDALWYVADRLHDLHTETDVSP